MKNHVWLKLLTAGSVACLVAACNDNDGGGPTGEITVASDTLTVKANDLRGVTFARSGKIYASGHTDADAADRKLVVARFNADGSPDTSFSGDGFAELNVVEGGIEQTLSIVELAGGDIVVAVNAGDQNGGEAITPSDNPAATPGVRAEGSSVYLVRFTSDGTPVTTFGTDGRVEVVFGWSNADNDEWPVPTFSTTEGFSHAGFPTDTAYDLQIDDSGDAERLVVFGFGSAANAETGTQRVDVDRYVARVLASTGAADPSFNAGKAFTWTSAGTLNDNGRRGIVEDDGKITSCGYTNFGDEEGGNHVVLFRLTAAGALDASFTGFGLTPVQQGIAVFNPLKVDGGEAECYGVAKQSDGDYVTTGYGAATGGQSTPSTLGFLPTQAQDLVSFQVDDGALDSDWGNNGNVVLQSESLGRTSKEERGRHIVALDDDRIVQVGYFAGTPAIYVLTEDGDLDSSFDGDGILELPNATVTQQFFNVALSPDGKRLAVTTSTNANGARLVLLDIDA
ncbi:MAG TPA: hypothetical protein VGE51_04795 [Fontimonas sp.]